MTGPDPTRSGKQGTNLTQETWTRGGLHLRDVSVDVPFDHFGRGGARSAAASLAAPVSAKPVGASSTVGPGTIEVFARIVAAEAESTKPYLVYLQGGPGVEAPRPTTPVGKGSWLARALEDFQVVMFDQRGTGKSSPIGCLEGRITGLDWAGEEPADIAEALGRYRADSIVEDAEVLRAALEIDSWSLLGQSFGGFTALRYVSAHSESLDEVYFTGGLPAIGVDPAEIYARTWAGMQRKSEQFYRDFPGDREKLSRLVDLAETEGGLALPSGARASRERLRLLGHFLGASDGPEKLHYLLDLDPASAAFRHDLAAALPFSGRNPLYAVVHESCWADGTVTNWAARRAMPAEVRADPTLLAGEHAGPESLQEDPELTPFAEVAELVAGRQWPRLYDVSALQASPVRGAAAVYFEDAYVPVEHSLATAEHLGGVKPWVTNEYEHNGLRADGYRVLDRLISLARD
ncbi:MULTISPECIES: alpha/beta fold hydrolase [unclassified Brevibacterium]|uniref:alpha/beta fold hydrolase n=1 Tax=unclassified Brevibacterium TaxID=2614124 RepID=UPI001E50195D|nr:MULTISPECIES: alpha/beta fold hydrolase [unclassified Brevibacterium]MDK8434920.1 alpha/beta fold hydrolase [Brevibacterium sp. H-BE7]